jgi:hypothetical protein
MDAIQRRCLRGHASAALAAAPSKQYGVTHLTETATGWSDPRHRSYLQRHGFDRRLGTARLREDKVKRPETPLRARPLIGHTNELGHAVATWRRFAGSLATAGPDRRSTPSDRTCSAIAACWWAIAALVHRRLRWHKYRHLSALPSQKRARLSINYNGGD